MLRGRDDAMRTLTAIVIAMLLSAASASAQWVEPIIRVTSTFRTPLDVADPRAGPEAKVQEAARRTLYEMAANECAILAETLKAECRLSAVTVLPFVVPTAPNAPPASMNATAVYDLRPKASSGR